MPETSKKQVGELAVQQGLITAEQLREALQEFSVRRAAGSRLPLGEVFIELEFITRAQLDQLLAAQGGKKGPRQQIPGFELIRKLGEGGMGATYLARQVSMDRLVALKVLRKKLSEKGDFIARFKREAHLAGRLNHLNIVQAMDVGESSGFHYLVMEYVEGRNLVDVMPEDGSMNEGRALELVLQVARALSFADEQGIIHRDIKPDNIMVTAENTAKLCDFGLAKQTEDDSGLTQTGIAMGTPHYISPEQARGAANMDIRGDIYSLGATLYHLVTGQTPYQGPTAAVVMTKHLNEQLPWPQDVNPEVSDGCATVITKMMAKDPDDRYQAPVDLISDLEEVIAGRPPKLANLGKGRSSVARRGAVPVRPRAARSRSKRYRTTRMKAATRTSMTEAIPAEAAGASKLPYIAGGGLLLIMALGMWLVIGSDDDPPEPVKPTPTVEIDAQRTWGTKIEPLAVDGIKPAQAKVLLAALSSFSADYGRTRFAADRAGEIAKLNALARKAITGADKAVEDMFKYAMAHWEKNPEDYDGTIRKLKTVLSSAKGTVTEMKAVDAIKDVQQAREKAVAAVLEGLVGKCEPLAANGDFDAALAILSGPQSRFAERLAPGLKAERERLHSLARSRLKSPLERALRLSKQGNPGQGLAALDKVESIRYAPWKKRLAALRARLKKEQLDVAALERKRLGTEARKKLDELLDWSDELAAKGKLADAAKHLADGRKKLNKEQLAAIEKEMVAAKAVVRSLVDREAAGKTALERLKGTTTDVRTRTQRYRKCKITRLWPDGISIEYKRYIMGQPSTVGTKIKFTQLAPGEMARLLPSPEPKTAHDKVAAALMAMHARRFAEAEKLLKATTAHPLNSRYRRKLDILRLGAVEAAAKEDWRSKVQTLVSPKFSLPEAKAMIAALDGFTARHGKTTFARGQKTEAARLRSLAEARIEASPEGLTHKIGKLFNGKVKSFDPRTCRIELFYDFEDDKQLRDWTEARAGSSNGKSMLLETTEHEWRGRRLELRAYLKTEVLEFDLTSATVQSRHLSCRFDDLDFSRHRYPTGTQLEFTSRGASLSSGSKRERAAEVLKSDVAYRMSLTSRGTKVVWNVNGRKMLSTERRAKGLRLGFGTRAKNNKWHFDNLRIVGRLDRRWLEAAAALAGKPSPWQAAWTQKKAHRGMSGYSTADFDSKRGMLTALTGQYEAMRYDFRADKWKNLHKRMVGDGTSLPKAVHCIGGIYLPKADKFLVAGVGKDLLFDPVTNKWSQTAGEQSGAYPALALGGGRTLRATGNSRGNFVFHELDPRRMNWIAIKAKSQPLYRTYCGGNLVFDSRRKLFLMYSGLSLADTWTFDYQARKWTEHFPAASPPASIRPMMCYDLANNLTVLAPVRRGGGAWVYDAGRNSWFELKASGTPSYGRCSLVYDPVNRCALYYKHGYRGGGGRLWTLRLSPARR